MVWNEFLLCLKYGSAVPFSHLDSFPFPIPCKRKAEPNGNRHTGTRFHPSSILVPSSIMPEMGYMVRSESLPRRTYEESSSTIDRLEKKRNDSGKEKKQKQEEKRSSKESPRGRWKRRKERRGQEGRRRGNVLYVSERFQVSSHHSIPFF